MMATAAIRWLHRAALASYLGLFALLMAWMVWLAPPPVALRSPLLLVFVAPLLLPLRGVLHARRYTLAWSSLLILGYFVHGIASAAGAAPVRWLGLAETVLSVAYFGCAIAYVRLTRPAPAS